MRGRSKAERATAGDAGPRRADAVPDAPSGPGTLSSERRFELATTGLRSRDRLAKAIVEGLEALGEVASRATVQRWIAEGRVKLDERPARAASTPLRDVQRIVVTPSPPPPSQATPDPSVHLDVVYEDDAVLVVDKPAGLVVHPARGHATGTLVHGLLAHPTFDPHVASADGGDLDVLVRPGIVHRLDRGTSGLLVVAKTARARERLKAAFAAHDIDREYLALAVGQVEAQTIDSLHGRHPRDRLKFTCLGHPVGARRAVTHVAVEERFAEATAVVCTLETGRTHQIRVHLAERLRAPILGDPLYGVTPSAPVLAELAASLRRQALHARVLGFTHPTTGRRVRWESPLPDDLRYALDTLRSAKPTNRSSATRTRR
jgi:23S rRNA pseudouridine1911/1915/1917 synthase